MSTKKGLRRLSSLILLGILLVFSIVLNAATFPTPTRYKYLNDYAGVVDQNTANQIISLGKELEDKTGSEVVIVTLNTLEGIPIEDYANNLFRSWGIGQKDKDNGLLILIAIEDQNWRVEVGRGLEGAIPDVLSNRIMQQLAKPHFTSGNYSEGLANSYSQFCDQIASEYNVTLTHSLHTTLPTSNTNMQHGGKVGGLVLIGFVFIDLLFNRGRLLSFILQMIFWSNFSNRGNPRGGGGSFGGFGGGSSNGGGSSGSW